MGDRQRLVRASVTRSRRDRDREDRRPGHALTIDSGWKDVADTSLVFIARFVKPVAWAGSLPIGRPSQIEHDESATGSTYPRGHWTTNARPTTTEGRPRDADAGDMTRWGQVGGVLIVVGSAMYLLGVAIAAFGGPSDPWVLVATDPLVASALLVGGIGAAIVAVTEPDPVCGPAVRVGLGSLALGLLALAAGAAANAIALGSGTDPLSTVAAPLAVLGFFATLGGLVVTGLALARRPGPTAFVGRLLLAGLLCVTVAVILRAGHLLPTTVLGALAELGAAAMMLAGIGIGTLAVVGRPSPSVEAP
jgi:hypothetical protein